MDVTHLLVFIVCKPRHVCKQTSLGRSENRFLIDAALQLSVVGKVARRKCTHIDDFTVGKIKNCSFLIRMAVIEQG